MKKLTLILELIGILAFSFASVALLVFAACGMTGREFNLAMAVVIWFAWFGINTIRSKLDERND